jgi:hypothetical protein
MAAAAVEYYAKHFKHRLGCAHQDHNAEWAFVCVLKHFGDLAALGLLTVAHHVLRRDDLQPESTHSHICTPPRSAFIDQ